jgi:hypothetical protein
MTRRLRYSWAFCGPCIIAARPRASSLASRLARGPVSSAPRGLRHITARTTSAILAAMRSTLKQREDLVGGLVVQVAGGLVGRADCRVIDEGAANSSYTGVVMSRRRECHTGIAGGDGGSAMPSPFRGKSPISSTRPQDRFLRSVSPGAAPGINPPLESKSIVSLPRSWPCSEFASASAPTRIARGAGSRPGAAGRCPPHRDPTGDALSPKGWKTAAFRPC